MDESPKKIVPLLDYCKDHGITDIEKCRREMKPFRCIVRIRGIEYFSESAYDEGIGEVFEEKRSMKKDAGKRQVSDYSYHKRLVTSSPRWISGKKKAIEEAETKLKGLKDPDERFRQKLVVSKLREDLARMEKAYSESQAILKQLQSDAGSLS